ncbi:hypothetical protein [Clostridium thermarum]|uniref:hypothetical protein n=1 Tax=Clostridium thermarum TaxID=1716543 RepID=UPI0013D270E1|nr:hypothetical protein [Clostridium thermarum]
MYKSLFMMLGGIYLLVLAVGLAIFSFCGFLIKRKNMQKEQSGVDSEFVMPAENIDNMETSMVRTVTTTSNIAISTVAEGLATEDIATESMSVEAIEVGDNSTDNFN